MPNPKKYNPSVIEPKWQARWEKQGIYQTKDKVATKKNYYCLVMFPYSSGDAHIGHWYNFAPADVYARLQRMQGKNVLHPMGFDAFGLPAEGAAIKKKVHPAIWTKDNIKKMTRQLKTIGAAYDWSRVVRTCDPSYYRFTQWMFLQMFKNGLAYKKKAMANWCPECQSILANEQAEGGKCWRCEGPVEQREIEQWFFRITKYADELLEDLKKLDWPEKTKKMQKNWIGKSGGCTIKFSKGQDCIEVFTTRPDTIYGATFFVLSPENSLVEELTKPKYKKAVEKYVALSAKKTELERIAEIKEKTGVFTGSFVKNPLSGKKIPVYVADFVLMSYGTGAVMGVPGHDQRDWEFAKEHKLPIIEVISGGDIKKGAYIGEGKLVNSGKFNGQLSQKAIQNITKYIEKHKLGKRSVQYHLRDWLVSRQRYWGAPIPMIFCPACARKGLSFTKDSPLYMAGWFPVPERELPVLLPKISNYTPKEGESPLARARDWVKVACPECGGPARRETDTMDTFVCSSWYYLRYVDPKNNKRFAHPELVEGWLPVDMYIGGAEHTVLHLLYSRFFTKALRDAGFLDFDEPFSRLRHQGVILGEDGYKMSKSRGNVVNPDKFVKKYGADTVRIYLCFMGPYDQGGPWNSKGIKGVYRFLNRVWQLTQRCHPDVTSGSPPTKKERFWINKTIKKVTEDISSFDFNTAVSSLMEYVNFLSDQKRVSSQAIKTLVFLLAPFAPHITEELWRSGFKEKLSIHQQPWPKYKEVLTQEAMVTIILEVDGKVRDKIQVKSQKSKVKSEVITLAKQSLKIKKYLMGQTIKKEIFVPGKLVNFVTAHGKS